jgi:hypothetical protein
VPEVLQESNRQRLFSLAVGLVSLIFKPIRNENTDAYEKRVRKPIGAIAHLAIFLPTRETWRGRGLQRKEK